MMHRPNPAIERTSAGWLLRALAHDALRGHPMAATTHGLRQASE